MNRMPCTEKPRFLRDCLYEWEDASNGVTAKTNAENSKYWNHYTTYADKEKSTPTLTDPYLPSNLTLSQAHFLLGPGQENTEEEKNKVSGVTDNLMDVSKTIELVGQPSDLYREDNKY